jgi:hypothetical protein
MSAELHAGLMAFDRALAYRRALLGLRCTMAPIRWPAFPGVSARSTYA